MRFSAKKDLSDTIRKAHVYISAERFEAAERLLKSVLAEDGSLAHLHNLLGLNYHKQSKFPEALTEFSKALKINPSYIEAGLNLSITLADLGRYDEAKEVYGSLVALGKQTKNQPSLILGRIANLHVQNGHAYEESGMSFEAIQEYKRALGLYDDMPDVRLKLARLYFRIGQFDKSLREFEDIVKNHSDIVEARVWLGILLYKLGRLQQAKDLWESADDKDPSGKSDAHVFALVSQEWLAGALS